MTSEFVADTTVVKKQQVQENVFWCRGDDAIYSPPEDLEPFLRDELERNPHNLIFYAWKLVKKREIYFEFGPRPNEHWMPLYEWNTIMGELVSTAFDVFGRDSITYWAYRTRDDAIGAGFFHPNDVSFNNLCWKEKQNSLTKKERESRVETLTVRGDHYVSFT